ncbi:MAG: response regulator [Candidatus Kuenenia sp.]|nr:response regulator [Candidatus Kuenenia hertensis]
MKIRHKLVIILAVLLISLNGIVGFFIYKRTRQEFVKEIREKARMLVIELETSRNYLASIMDKIEINEQTTKFIPAIATNAISKNFAEKTGYIIKQTSLRYRNKENKPDSFEEEILRKMEKDPGIVEYWADDLIEGKRVERYIYPLYVKEECLLCHGPKEKAPKVVQENYNTGYDYKLGEIRGALSVIIPKEIAEQRYASAIIFFIVIGSTSIMLVVIIIFFTTNKFLKPIEKLTAAATTIRKTGDLTTKVEISTNDEVGQLGEAFNDMSSKLRSSYASLEQRIAEKTEHLQRAVSALKRANRMKSEFLANMSHELRTPLNAIIGFAEVLKDKLCGDLNAEQEDFVKDIHSSGQHLLQMINDILDLSKIEAGKMELQYEVFLLPDAIEEVYTILKGLAKKKQLHLETFLHDDVKDIEADRVKFKQILYNLLSNAIKFTPQNGTITTRASIINGKIQVSVSDSGIGIKSEEQKKVFKEFWQADSSFSRKYEGTGLGLALTKRIVELHRGNIWFESEYGKGSTFYFALPLAKPSEIPSLKDKEANLHKLSATAQKCKTTILVIEDNRMSADLLTVYLTNAGYNVILASDGREAVEKAKKYKPCLITLDILLPGIDGWEVISRLKSDKDTAHIPVIIVSIVDNKDLGYSLGAAEYLIKPIGRKQLIDAVNTVAHTLKAKDKPMKILVVDDDEKAVKYINTILKEKEFTVFKAYGGEAGINIALEKHPDIIILDLMMPEVSGFDVIEKLKAHPEAKEIPIIICSAKDITSEEKRELNGKILAIIQKGSHTKEDLLEAIKKMEQTI